MRIILCVLLLLFPAVLHAKEPVARTVLALYDSAYHKKIQHTPAHKFAEMPLNHLGLTLEYHDIQQGLPDLIARKDIRGVLSWFGPDTKIEDRDAYLQWAEQTIISGKRFLLMGNPGFFSDITLRPKEIAKVNRLLNLLGIAYEDEWVGITYNARFTKQDRNMLPFERSLETFKPAYNVMTPVGRGTIHLSAKRYDTDPENVLVMTNTHGGYVADGYEVFSKYSEAQTREYREWYLNPFRFFAAAFATQNLPKPDTTTLAGRRIYYSHIDGDGWNNLTFIPEYDEPTLSSRVIAEKAIAPYSDLPVSVAVIAGDIDPNWVGSKKSQHVTQILLALPHVETASHTYSHPFDWSFFADGDPEKERPFLQRYKTGRWDKKDYHKGKKPRQETHYEVQDNLEDYLIPRAFANEPFSLTKEMRGAADYISQFAPADKPVTIVMWSGDTTPFEGALVEARKAGLFNINGGDTRFDTLYPSYAWVAPIGRAVGKERQIYTSASNENLYTNLWEGPYHGFKYLTQTLENTERPIRIKPLNIYYHMYSGEYLASLHALLHNLDYARTQAITPITASHYAAIAEGFYSTRITALGEGRWHISNRGKLQTIRFDNASMKTVDFRRSKGVIGHQHFQGSLYVYLDEHEPEPIIGLTDYSKAHTQPPAKQPYIIESRWHIWDVKSNRHSVSFSTQGFGDGDMYWKMPEKGRYRVNLVGDKKEPLIVSTNNRNVLHVQLKKSAIHPVTLHIELEPK